MGAVMPATNKLDFSSAQAADKALKQVSQLMIRAGQPVIATEFVQKPKRSNSITYREASLSLASGQIVTLRVNVTGDIYQVLLNRKEMPIKSHDDTGKAVIEIAGMAEKNQAAFQKAQARVKVEIPQGLATPPKKMLAVLTERSAQLDTEIAERKATVADLEQQLGAMTDSAGTINLDNLDDGALDTLRALAEVGPLEDGDVPSKTGRDCLVELGYVDRYTDKGANVLTARGVEAAAMLDAASAQPKLLLSGAYVAAREIVLADPSLMDSAATAGAIEQLNQALAVVECNAPINEAEGNLDQAKLERRLAASFRTAIAMLDSAGTAFTGEGLAELVNIASVSAAEDSDIKDQAALAQLLALGLVETAEGLYMATAKGRSVLDDAGYDIYGEPYASNDD